MTLTGCPAGVRLTAVGELVVQRRGTERLAETVAAYQTVLQGNMRPAAVEAIRSADRWINDDDRLWVVAQAQLRGDYKVPVIVLMTDKRLITISEHSLEVIDSTARSELSIAEWR